MLCAPLNNDQSPPDELFLERFETFMEKILMEIQAFSEREGRKLDEIRKDVARWHCNHIFQSQSLSSSSENSNRPNEIWNILSSVSRVLESLHHVFGLESFVLAVDPEESPILSYPSEGFLGGTMQGREFWRGLRTGGESGARAFKEHCVKNKAPRKPDAIVNYKQMDTDKSTKGSASVSSKQSAKNVKIDLYDGMRKALRSVSGIRNAEMKWTNHERLFTYGVYLVGWPSDIPVKNPSSLKTDQNKRLLELLNNGTLKFMKNILLASGSGLDQVDSVNEDAPVEEWKRRMKQRCPMRCFPGLSNTMWIARLL
ncbi:hypothetical protein BT96DRAFT_809070 [Gymnopus androsaceus JB14]|uniref:Uncharacterized protein n=1 Tax=Gymnopus androsaceus JB14 TaxID=1447944 RepID=A0A6A4IDL9_9AGAR|nr:hypothetical protein BT96DRAFT_809070 [Gymnopus androsaceus JB14]